MEDGDVVGPGVALVGIHGGDPDADDHRLIDDRGVEYPLEAEWFATSVRFESQTDLPDGDYTFQDAIPGGEVVRFTVASDEVFAPPSRPVNLFHRWFTAWEGGDKLQLEWSGSPEAAFYEIEVAPTDGFASVERAFALDDLVQFGSVDCGTSAVRGYDTGARSFFRIRAVGWDGEPSDWSDTLRVGGRSPLACSTGPSGTVGWLALLTGFGLLRTRRSQ
jgi:hypothetical protein